MNYDALKALVDGEPSNATKTAAEVAAWCNTDSGTPVVSSRRVTAQLMADAIEDAVAMSSALTSMEQAGGASKRFVRWAESSTGIDIGSAQARVQLDQLVVAGVFTATQASKIKALAERSQTRAAAAGIRGKVKVGHIETLALRAQSAGGE